MSLVVGQRFCRTRPPGSRERWEPGGQYGWQATVAAAASAAAAISSIAATARGGRQAGQSRRPAGQSRRPATITAVPTPSAIALVPVRSSGAYPWIALLGLIPSGGEIVPSWIKRSTRADDDVAGDNPVRKRLLQCRRSFTED